MGYAAGKYALGLCDRCGFQYKLNELKEEYNPRPNNDKESGEGFVVVVDANVFSDTSNNFLAMNPATLGTNFKLDKMTTSIGTVTITT